MIVRNESRVIERCLEAALPVVDYMSICDTGSDDNTVQIIENFFDQHGVEGAVHHHVWQDFGHNRSLSLKSSRDAFPTTDYFLTLDADHLLVIEPEFEHERATLDADAYCIVQKTGHWRYFNLRLLRSDHRWRSECVTHEYWACDEPPDYRMNELHSLWIDDRNDGGFKTDKFPRDEKLILERGFPSGKHKERYTFYLAETYKNMEQYRKAMEWYHKRVDLGGWWEEVWFSMYQIGECHQRLGDWPKALEWYLKAFNFDPARAEPLNNVVRYFRELPDQQQLAWLFLEKALQIPYPKHHQLFVVDTVYDWELEYEASIICSWVGQDERGVQACQKLLENQRAPEHIRQHGIDGLQFYRDRS